MAEQDGIRIDSLELFDSAKRLAEEKNNREFLDNVVDVIAHCLADHTEPPRILSEADHDLIRLAASVALLASAILEETDG